MTNLCIDESGSMTVKYSSDFPYFVICLVNVIDIKKVNKLYKKLFKRNKDLFTLSSDNKYELKGAKLKKDQKKFLASYFNKPDLLKVYYIRVDNQRFFDDTIYKNKARAFNYLIARDFEHLLNYKYFLFDNYFLYIDNRNVKNDSIKSLEDYLYVKFTLETPRIAGIRANYYDSKNVKNIQIADFFSNLFYSDLITGGFESDITALRESGVIKDFFLYPIF